MPALNVSDWLNSQDNLLRDSRTSNNNNQQGNNNEPHAPLSPQSSVTSSGSGSDTQQQSDEPQQNRNTFLEEGSGMKGKLLKNEGKALRWKDEKPFFE